MTTKFNYAVHFGFQVGTLNAAGLDVIDGERTGGLNTLYIYTDIIKEQIVGGIY